MTTTTDTPTRQHQASELSGNLAHFTGSCEQYLHWTRRLLHTEGVQYLAEQAGAYWLIDAIASYQTGKARRRLNEICGHLQVWVLKVDHSDKPKGTMQSPMAVLTASRDRGRDGEVIDRAIRQAVPFTDFPLDEIVLYAADNGNGTVTLMLRSEY